MDDPVFDFYKGFYKKASSWFLGIIIVLIIIAFIGIAYITVSKLKTKVDNLKAQTTTQSTDTAKDTQVDSLDLYSHPDDTNGTLNQDLQDGGSTTDPNNNPSAATLPQDDFGL